MTGALKRLFELPIVLSRTVLSLVITMIFPRETGIALAHTLSYMCGNAFTLAETLAVALVQLGTHAMSHALWMAATRQPLSPPPDGAVANFYEYQHTQEQIP